MPFEARIELVVIRNDERFATPRDLRILEDYEMCNRYRVLPEFGGLYDQSAEIIAKFKVIDKVMDKKAKWEQQKHEMAERAREQAAGGNL